MSGYFDRLSVSGSRATSEASSSIPTSPSNSPTSISSKPQQSSQFSQDFMDQDVGFAHSIIAAEARSVLQASERLRLDPQTRHHFSKALEMIAKATKRTGLIDDGDDQDSMHLVVERRGKVVWTGVGKSGLVARKLCSSMQSLGIPSVFLHPVEALHGDLGMLSPGRDVVIAISHSGGSPELQALLPHIKRRRCPLIAFTAKQESALGRAADAWVDCRTASADLGEFISRETNQKQQDLDVRIANSDVDSLPLEPTQINIQEEEQEREEEADGSGYSSNSPSGSVSNSTSNVSTPSLLYENNDSFSASNSNSSSNASSSEDVSSIEQLSIDETCEAFPHAPAPTCSTSVAMAMGDALVVASARADARAERLTQEEFKATLRKKEEERQVKIKEQQRLAQLEEANQTIHISSGGKVQFSRDDKKRLVVQVNDELDAKGLRRAFAKNHPGGSLGKELELEGDDNGQAIKV